MQIISWNLAHQTWPRPIPDDMADILLALGADTVLFNEYVDEESRVPFKSAMREAGFEHQTISPAPERHNRIFAASRLAFKPGDLDPPRHDSRASSNFLHLRFIDHPVEVVGIRAPAYKLKSDLRAYWAELAGIMGGVKDRAILFVGDINRDPFLESGQLGAKSIAFDLCGGYTVPNPAGEWSFHTGTGNGYRIDHVIHSGAVKVGAVGYVDRIGDRLLAGPRSDNPISDHAVLRFVTVGPRT